MRIPIRLFENRHTAFPWRNDLQEMREALKPSRDWRAAPRPASPKVGKLDSTPSPARAIPA